MVNGLILAKFDQQVYLIQKILIDYLSLKQHLEQKNPILKPPITKSENLEQKKPILKPPIIKNEGKFNLKVIQTIKTLHSSEINSICILKDERIVSCSWDCSIVIYSQSYKSQVIIKNAHDGGIYSLCVLGNGYLVSSSFDKTIKIWKINKNNYELLYTLRGHSNWVYKVIELESGKICSCSNDATIKIWNNIYNYMFMRSLEGHAKGVTSIIEMKNYIISASDDSTLRIWDELAFNCIKTINDVKCYSRNGLSILNDTTLLVGGWNALYIVNIETYKVNKIEDKLLRNVCCFNILINGAVLFGSSEGDICYFDSISNQITLRQKFHSGSISCLIKTEDNKLISSSQDTNINIYELCL